MRHALTAALCALLTAPGAARAGTYYVATSGNDTTGDGSASKPWATISHAVQKIPDDGSTVLVKDGTYTGQVALSRAFGKMATIRAEHPYRAVLTNPGDKVVYSYIPGPGNFTLSGFEITSGSGATCTSREEVLIHLQDVSSVVLEDNVIHDAAVAGNCNELLKLNSGTPNVAPHDVKIRGNVFYNPSPIEGADLIDCVAIEDVDITDNIFFSALQETSSTSFVMIKSQKQFTNGHTPRSPRFRVARNIFLSWAGASDQAFILFGEDGQPYHEVTDSLIENNLLLGNSALPIVAAFQLKGAKDITIRANTVVGDLPGGTLALRAGTELQNPSVEGIKIVNNLFSDPSGTMTHRLVNTYGNALLGTFKLENNLYWNSGADMTKWFTDGTLGVEDDPRPVYGDPKVAGDQATLVLPLWDAKAGAFKSGSATIKEELVRLAKGYGALGAGSAALGAADPAQMPSDDLLGAARGSKPSIGALEWPGATPGGDSSARSDVNTRLGDAPLPREAGATLDTGATTPPGEKSGCGCATAPAGGERLGLLALAALLASLARRRR